MLSSVTLRVEIRYLLAVREQTHDGSPGVTPQTSYGDLQR
jgi:hypothetical protein